MEREEILIFLFGFCILLLAAFLLHPQKDKNTLYKMALPFGAFVMSILVGKLEQRIENCYFTMLNSSESTASIKRESFLTDEPFSKEGSFIEQPSLSGSDGKIKRSPIYPFHSPFVFYQKTN